jgi:nitrite reductase/ring-hydroxylating ferredoxin subunit/uncharacterized membrane protein
MPSSPSIVERTVNRLERATSLDAVSERLAALLRKVIRPGPVEDVLSGTPLGHPLHPVLVSVPIGAWVSASVLDALGADEDAARQLTAAGILTAIPTALAGSSDWLSTAGAERRIGLVHAVSTDAVVATHMVSWVLRRRGRRSAAAAVSAGALALLGVAGWLGGHLAYALGVGIDTTVFQRFPADWADAGAEADIGSGLHRVEIDGVPIVLFRAEGAIVALADRCTHRGGPLHDGELADGCLVCPWHGSVFTAHGAVVSGPATRPQPSLQVRVVAGRVQVRRDEERTLRKNPV